MPVRARGRRAWNLHYEWTTALEKPSSSTQHRSRGDPHSNCVVGFFASLCIFNDCAVVRGSLRGRLPEMAGKTNEIKVKIHAKRPGIECMLRKTLSVPVSAPERPVRFESCQDADWCHLPGTAMTVVLRQLESSDICSIRLVSRDWFNSATQCLESLKPNAFHPGYLMRDFRLLRSLDLSECVGEVTAKGMVFLEFLQHLNHVSLGRHHNLISATINDSCMFQLTRLKKMKKLNLAQCVHITDHGLYHLAQSLKMLEELNLSGCISVTDRGVGALAQIGSLRSLEMPWCLKVSDLGIEALTAQPKLRHLNVCGCQLITEAGISLLAHFSELETLNLLNTGFGKICVTDAALRQLILPNLKSFSVGNHHLHNSRVTDVGIRSMVKNSPNLEQLTLMWIDISDNVVYDISKLNCLKGLCLRGCQRLTTDALTHVACLFNLQELNLQNNPCIEMNDDVLEQIAPLKNIEKLSIGDDHVNNILSDNGVATLAGFKKMKTLNLSHFAWQFAGAGLGPLLSLHQIESLDLTGNAYVSDSTLQVIGCLQNVTSLALNRCEKISSNGLKHLRRLKLQNLSMAGCYRVNDQGLVSLSEISTLTSLNLSLCFTITDWGLSHLKKCQKLKNLDVSGCRELLGDGFEGFCDLPLSTLSLSGVPLLHNEALIHIGRIRTLAKLDMCSCGSISDAGIRALRNLENLTGVDISSCHLLGDAAIQTFSLLPQLTTLKATNCTMVTDYGTSHLVRLPGLLTAHFDGCMNMSDQSLMHLGNCESLTCLRMERCVRITDAGVAHLAKLNQLSILNLARCPFVTENGIRNLASLPALASFEY